MRIRSWYLYYRIHEENTKFALNSRLTRVFGDFCEAVFSRTSARNSKLIVQIYEKIELNEDNGDALKNDDVEKHKNSLRYVINEISQISTTKNIHEQEFDWTWENILTKNNTTSHLKSRK